MKRKLILSLLTVLLMPLLILLPTQGVSAHAEYDHSEPAADAIVEAAPTQVRIWFTQELFRRQGVNSIEVEGPDGTRADQNDMSIDDDDRALAMVSLAPTLPAGLYTVHWVATSAEDGHEGKGEFTFTIAGAATGETASEATTTSEEAPSATATPESQPTATETPAAVESDAPPTVAATATPAGGGAALPCLGGAMPLVVVLGAVLAGGRRQG